MTGAPLRVGTRGSDLALYQARRVAARIEERLGRRAEVVIIETTGDRDGRTPLAALGEVGVFTKEIERALLAREVDVAVHSLKDLPTTLPEGLALAAVPERVDPGDTLIGRAPLEALPPGARIGTSSKRRRLEVEEARPDLRCEEIRGNVPTRVEKCRRGEYDAVILARAAIERLGLRLEPELGRFDLPLDRFLPAPGQGALAVETRVEDAPALAPLDDPAAARTTAAERELLRLIQGGCSVPLGARARLLADGRVELAACLGRSLSPHSTLGVRPNKKRTLAQGAAAEGGEARARCDELGTGNWELGIANSQFSVPSSSQAATTVRALLRRALVRADTPEAAARLAFRVLRPDGAEPDGGSPAALAGRRVVLTRDDGDLAAALEAAGAEVRVVPAIEVVPRVPAPELPPCRWTLVASRNAAAALRGAGLDRVGVVGPGTAEVMAQQGIAVDLIAERADGGALAESFLGLGEPAGTTVLLPGAAEGRAELRERLLAAGYDVRPVAVYDTRRLAAPIPADAEAIVFASPSAVRPAPAGARVVAIGPATAEAARAAGLEPVVAERPTTAALLAAVAHALG